VKQKTIEHYANETRPERCLVKLYKKYLAGCSETAIAAKDVFLFITSKSKETV
jgi:hypothetical protein